ncbi:MAG: hypothetical protein AMXMBFR13_07630 [Phycisphaerae bacterium]
MQSTSWVQKGCGALPALACLAASGAVELRAAEFLQREQQTPLAAAPRITGLQHSVLHYDKSTYCGHPRMVAFEYFGKGEILVGHFHAPSKYKVYDDVRHVSYQSRAVCLLQRSTDYGKTWPKENESVVLDRVRFVQDPGEILNRTGEREKYDMFKPGAMFFSQNTWELAPPPRQCFFLRSPDKGKTWEKVPTVIANPHGGEYGITRHDTPIIRRPDGKTLLATFSMAGKTEDGKETEGEPAVFSSTDQGVTWTFLSRPIVDPTGRGLFIYPTLLQLSNGELQCYVVHLAKKGYYPVEGLLNAMAVVSSSDGGKTWSEPTVISGKGAGAWKNPGKEGHMYRSPWPIQLQDGRILVIFARRRQPTGIGGIISTDGGNRWSEEFIIRDDGNTWTDGKHEEGDWGDLGYPVACQFEDGQIFTAYYFNNDEAHPQGGTRFIGASTFRLAPAEAKK